MEPFAGAPAVSFGAPRARARDSGLAFKRRQHTRFGRAVGMDASLTFVLFACVTLSNVACVHLNVARLRSGLPRACHGGHLSCSQLGYIKSAIQ